MRALLLVASLIALSTSPPHSLKQPVRISIARLTHDHVHWVFGRPDRGDIEVVGIYEPDHALRERYATRYGLDRSLFFDDLETMLDVARPEAVAAFGSIREHLSVVEAAAPRGIHVMVEKPLAFETADAMAIRALSEEHGIHVLTNYETTWYASTYAAGAVVGRGELGDLRKIVVHDGHEGPKEIGISDEFLEWLTDPAENGGGALIDFGCYGANLITWLMNGAEPLSVTAVTQRIKPKVYPRVDDEATIILEYPHAQGIVQASWNWPFSRKDMEIYGTSGYAIAPDGSNLRIRTGAGEASTELERREYPHDDPISYLAAVVRGELKISDTDLSSLANNVIVVRILDAARQSAATGRTIEFKTPRR